MALQLPETTLIKIRKNLKLVGEDLDESIVNQNLNLETKEDNKQKVWDENIINKTKTELSSDEKTRFINISKLFVNEWVEQIKKIQAAQEKRDKLTGAVPLNPPKKKPSFEFLTNLLANRKKKPVAPPKPKKKNSWLSKILKVIGAIGIGWALFEGVIKKIPGQVWDSIKDLGSEIGDLALGVLVIAWDWMKEKMEGLWGWIKDTLNLDEISEFFTKAWNKVEGWLGEIWGKVSGAWEETKKFILDLPGDIWDWICDTACALFDPVLDAIETGWNWLKDKVVGTWNWIKGQLDEFWEGLKKAWKSTVDFFTGIWDWVCDTFSFEKIWNSIKTFISTYIATLKEDIKLLLEGKIFEFIQRKFAFITDAFNKVISVIKKITPSSWWGDDDEDKKTVEHKQEKTEIKNNVKNVIEKQEDIVLKDNILDTVKDICDRINVFFSGNENGFIDLSGKLIKECQGGFVSLVDQFQKIKLQNIYEVENDYTYKDSYDQSDKSTKTINNDFSKNSNDDYSITYNTIDIPALNNAVSTIQKQTESELRLLQSQNDYLIKMISNIDGMSDKLNWLDPKKYREQAINNIVPIIGSAPKPKNTQYQTFDLKAAQAAYAQALG